MKAGSAVAITVFCITSAFFALLSNTMGVGLALCGAVAVVVFEGFGGYNK